MNLPCGVESNQKVGDLRSVILPVVHEIYDTAPINRVASEPVRVPCQDARSFSFLNAVDHLCEYRPTRNLGSLLFDKDIYNLSCSFLASSRSSESWSARLLTCRSSVSVDLRA